MATHKKYWMPTDEIYVPVHVGAEGKVDAEGKPLDLGYIKDNTGDNISKLNPSFFELTGLYDFQGRFYGRISEIIFNVWIDKKI